MNKQNKYLQQTKSRLLALLIVLFLGVSEMASLFAQTIVPEGALNGLFTVNANGDKVGFSQGNLQYIGSASTPYWKFADHQWDCLGTTTGQENSGQNVDRDLFCWGTSGYNHGAVCYQPWSMGSTTYTNHYYAYGCSSCNLYDRTGQADWGYNAISNGGNAENHGWRTLTRNEWAYVFNTRGTTSGIRYAKAMVNGMSGVVLLPDDWSASTYALNNTNTLDASFTANAITAWAWTNTFEANGAVFLPAAGQNKYGIHDFGSLGVYWTASCANSESAYYLKFDDGSLYLTNGGRATHFSVRLVCPIENYSFGINATPSPAEGGEVSGGGFFQCGTDCTLTATPATGYAFSNWMENGTVVSTEPTYSFAVWGVRNLVANFVPGIVFVDANVKAICIAHWDSNGDGQLGYDEAAAVTSLDNAFSFDADIVSFDELQYFTGLTSLDDYEFGFCGSLTSISVPCNILSIGEGAFSSCGNLATLTTYAVVPPTTGSDAFDGIPDNATVLVPSCSMAAYQEASLWSGITHYESFNGGVSCPIEFADANVKALCVANWDTNIDGELSYTEAAAVTDLDVVFQDNATITSFDELRYFTGLTSIGNRAFSNCFGLTSVEIPNSVTSIGNYAFNYCRSLTSIAIPNSVTSIGEYAFYHCSGLISVEIPNSVRSIRQYAFSGCSGLTSVSIGSSVTYIQNSWFQGCSSLAHIIVDEGNLVYDSRDNCNAIIHSFTNALVFGCKNTIIPNSVTSIGSGALSGCSGLTSVTIPNSVTSIGDSAFSGCSGLTSVTIPNSVTSIGSSAFRNCNGLTSVTIGNSVTSIGSYAFSGCSGLTSVTIGNSVTTIGGSAFDSCNGLTSIISYATTPPTLGTNVFRNVPTTAIVYVPCATAETYQADIRWEYFSNFMEMVVGDYCPIDFADDNVKAICIAQWDSNGDGELNYAEAAAVTDLGTCFRSNSTITAFDELQYFTGLTALPTAAFMSCISLSSISLPSSITSLGTGAFFNCTSLALLTVYAETPPMVGTNTFGNVNTSIPVRIPCESIEDYQGWGGFGNFVCFDVSFVVFANANPAAGGTISGAGTYNYGSNCTLTATPNLGYTFVNWTENGNIVSTEATCSFTVTGDKTLVACFELDPTDYSQEYFTITSWEPDNTITFHRGVANLDLYISFDKINWSLFTSSYVNTTVVLGVGEKAYFKASSYHYATSDSGSNYCYFSATKLFEASGNIMSLFKGDDFVGATSFYSTNDAYSYNCYGLFNGATTLLTLENLVLPATQYNKWVFQHFASGCTSLIKTPKELPAQTYQGRNTLVWMFSNCLKLQESPVIRLTSNASGDGWHQMFSGCTSLKRVICLMEGTNLSVNGGAWLKDVQSGGIFYKKSSSTWQSGNTAIPSSWTIRNWSGDPSNFVKVRSTPAYRYSCYVEGTSDYYQVGDAVTLKCTPINGYTFNGWYVNGAFVSANETYTFTATQDIEVTPCFDETMYIVNGYGNTDGGYHLIATPYAIVNPANVAGMLEGNYDLYYFDQEENLEWRNYKAQHFNLMAGTGYLYAHETDVLLGIIGTPYSGNGTFALKYVSGKPFAGWNLVGNPYAHSLTSYTTVNVANGCYVMNGTRDDLVVSEINNANPLNPYEGFFVKATDEGASISFSSGRGSMASRNASIRVDVLEGGNLIDRLLVKGSDADPLQKLSLNRQRTKVFANRNGEELAIVPCEGNEQPVCFKAVKNRTYTISVHADEMKVDYLHLIDHLTGANIDLLKTPTYTFTAKPSDYEARFELVFDKNWNGATAGSETFAYYNGSAWVIANEGSATLQVVDMMGRVISSTNCTDGACTVSTANLMQGVYMLRLISDDNIKVQKIVVR